MITKAKKRWPDTIAEAIRILDDVLTDAEKESIKSVPLSDLHRLKPWLGRLIQNAFGLLEGNGALITCTLEIDAELASMTIVREFWDHLRKQSVTQYH